jgi:hypothetical protein
MIGLFAATAVALWIGLRHHDTGSPIATTATDSAPSRPMIAHPLGAAASTRHRLTAAELRHERAWWESTTSILLTTIDRVRGISASMNDHPDDQTANANYFVPDKIANDWHSNDIPGWEDVIASLGDVARATLKKRIGETGGQLGVGDARVEGLSGLQNAVPAWARARFRSSGPSTSTLLRW